MGPLVLVFVAAAIFIIIFVSALMSRYKKCPSDKILVVYGKIGKDSDGTAKSSKCIHGGAAFIFPIIQNYRFLDLTPISIEVNLKNALSKQNIRVDVPSSFTVGISTEPSIMSNAAERLLGLSLKNIQDLAKDIIFGQLRLVIATMDIEEINTDRDKFLANVSKNVEAELKKIGLKLINVNITDIKDVSGYIDALGKEAAAKAINDALIKEAEARREGDIGVANADSDKRQRVAEANALAVEGENKSKIHIANSEAEKREKEAEANKRATTAEKIQEAKALEESYAAQKAAELSRADRERATKEADIVVKAQIDKKKVEIDTEAAAIRERIKAKGNADALREQASGEADAIRMRSEGEGDAIRNKSKGEADAILLKKQAEAQGNFEVLDKQAKAFEKLVLSASGDPQKAVMMMIADKLPELVGKQVEAIKNIKIDKVTVWDSGNGGKDGKTSTANFLSGMAGSVPPLQELFNMAGMNLPEFLGKDKVTKTPNKSYKPVINTISDLEDK